jgi:hypothetical protein
VATPSERADRLVEQLLSQRLTKQEPEGTTEAPPPRSVRAQLADQRKAGRKRMRHVRRLL